RYVQVVESDVVIVADASALSPSGEAQSRLFRYVRERSVMSDVQEMARRRGGFLLRGATGRTHLLSVDQKDVGPAIAVIVEDGDAGAGRFDDVVFGFRGPTYVGHGN